MWFEECILAEESWRFLPSTAIGDDGYCCSRCSSPCCLSFRPDWQRLRISAVGLKCDGQCTVPWSRSLFNMSMLNHFSMCQETLKFTMINFNPVWGITLSLKATFVRSTEFRIFDCDCWFGSDLRDSLTILTPYKFQLSVRDASTKISTLIVLATARHRC